MRQRTRRGGTALSALQTPASPRDHALQVIQQDSGDDGDRTYRR